MKGLPGEERLPRLIPERRVPPDKFPPFHRRLLCHLRPTPGLAVKPHRTASRPPLRPSVLEPGRWLPWLGPANSCKERGRVRRPKWALTGHGSRCWQGVLSAPIWPERCRPAKGQGALSALCLSAGPGTASHRGGRSFSPPSASWPGHGQPKGRALFQPSA